MSNEQSLEQVLSVYGMQRTIICEQYHEVAILPYMMKITKTDFGKALGLNEFWDGTYRNGEKYMIRLRDVINRAHWNRSLRKPIEHSLPPGFTIVSFSLTRTTGELHRYFLQYTAPRYRSLPDDHSKWMLYNSVRACAWWEAFEAKVSLEKQGLQGFACPEVYQRILEWRRLFKEYPLRRIPILAQAKAYRNSDGRYGIPPEVRDARLAKLYVEMDEECENIALRPLDIQLPPLPPGMPQFKLLEDPPVNAVTKGA